MLLRTACLTVIAVLSLPSGGSAQGSSSDSTFRAATNGLAIGTPLRVISSVGDTTYARLLGVGVIGLRWEDETYRAGYTPVAEIRELSAGRRAWRKGALIGGALGAVFGAVVGAAATGLCEGGQECPDATSSGIAGAFVVGAMGGIAGALVGSGFREWRVVYDGGARVP